MPLSSTMELVSSSGNVYIEGTGPFTNNGPFQWSGGQITDGSGFVNNSNFFSISVFGQTRLYLNPSRTQPRSPSRAAATSGLATAKSLPTRPALFDFADDSTVSAGVQGEAALPTQELFANPAARALPQSAYHFKHRNHRRKRRHAFIYQCALARSTGKLAFQLRGTTPASDYGNLYKPGNLALAGSCKSRLALASCPHLVTHST